MENANCLKNCEGLLVNSFDETSTNGTNFGDLFSGHWKQYLKYKGIKGEDINSRIQVKSF